VRGAGCLAQSRRVPPPVLPGVPKKASVTGLGNAGRLSSERLPAATESGLGRATRVVGLVKGPRLAVGTNKLAAISQPNRFGGGDSSRPRLSDAERRLAFRTAWNDGAFRAFEAGPLPTSPSVCLITGATGGCPGRMNGDSAFCRVRAAPHVNRPLVRETKPPARTTRSVGLLLGALHVYREPINGGTFFRT